MGDPAGVGPEIIVSAWGDPRMQAASRPVVIGHPEIMRRAAQRIGRELLINEIHSPEDAQPAPDVLPCLPCGETATLAVAGTCSAAGGEAAYQCVRSAANLALDRRIGGITTAPINKEALNTAGHNYPGHTELLAEICGVREFAMMLHLPPGEGAGGSNRYEYRPCHSAYCLAIRTRDTLPGRYLDEDSSGRRRRTKNAGLRGQT